MLKNLDEVALAAVATQLAEVIQAPALIFLRGDLGAGKTTLVRYFLQALGYSDVVKSPTYAVVEEYDFSTYQIYHFDLYRLRDPHELYELGIEDYLSPTAICFIEWPEQGAGVLPPPDLICQLDILETGRDLSLQASSPRAQKWLNRNELASRLNLIP